MLDNLLLITITLSIASTIVAFGSFRLTLNYYYKMEKYQKKIAGIMSTPLKPKIGDCYITTNPDTQSRIDYKWDGERWIKF